MKRIRIKTLFLRELQQYRGAFILAPLVLFVAMQVGALYSAFMLVKNVDASSMLHLQQESINITRDLGKLTHYEGFFPTPIHLFVIASVLVCLYYLIDSLISDRKDRSILFWRSMPVSEYENVAVKLLTSSFVVPCLFLVSGLLSSVVALSIIYLGIQVSGIEIQNIGSLFVYLSGLSSVFELAAIVLLFSIFLFPLQLGLLTASALVRRSIFFTLVLPVLAINVVELMVFKELILFKYLTNYISAAANLSEALVLGKEISTGLAPLLLGLVLSAGLYYASVYLRQRNFEV